MENQENDVVAPLSDEAASAEDAAFTASFGAERGIEPAPVVEPAVEPAATDPAAEPAATEALVDPAAPAEPAQAPRLIAGMTEEQLAAALGRGATLNGSVEKLAGRVGNIMQNLTNLQKAVATPAAQVALDLKFEKLSAQFPELAELLREDLRMLPAGAPATDAPVVVQPAGLTQEQFDAALSASEAKLAEQMEVRVLTITHPDWQKVIATDTFANYRDNVLPAGEGKALMESEDAGYISAGLTAYKSWQAAQLAPAPVVAPVVPPVVQQRRDRLANAVLPAGAGAQKAGSQPQTEEDAFNASFARARANSGH